MFRCPWLLWQTQQLTHTHTHEGLIEWLILLKSITMDLQCSNLFYRDINSNSWTSCQPTVTCTNPPDDTNLLFCLWLWPLYQRVCHAPRAAWPHQEVSPSASGRWRSEQTTDVQALQARLRPSNACKILLTYWPRDLDILGHSAKSATKTSANGIFWHVTCVIIVPHSGNKLKNEHNNRLVGGLEHFLCSHILGIIIPID